MDLRKLTNAVIRAYPVNFSSRDVREGVCRLGECHKKVPGLWYEPEEVLEGIFCFRKEALNLHQLFSSSLDGARLRTLWGKWVDEFCLFDTLLARTIEDLLDDSLVVEEIEEFLATIV